MFSRAKDKTKKVTIKLRAKVAMNNMATMATADTVSLASIPMANAHGVVAPPPEKIPGLYTAGRAPQSTKKSTAKKSLRFEEIRDIPDPLTPTAPPIAEEMVQAEDEITECDTATQTATVTEVTTNNSTDTDPVSTSDLTSTDPTDSQEELMTIIETPSHTTRHPKKTRKFHSVYLMKSTKGKQFRPHSPISNTAAYPIVRYLHAAQFKAVAKELNTLVQFFNLNTITPFLYDEELQFFLADYRQQQCKKMPFLKFAMEHMFKKYCLQVSPNVNRNPGGQADDTEEGEWVDIDDDSDDEISFPTRSIQVPTTQPAPIGTEQSTTTRQQDEYLDYREGQAIDAFNDTGILNESIYVSADEGDYNEQVAYDDYNETYYTPDAATIQTDTDLYNNTHEHNVESVGGDSQSHVDWLQNVENRIVSDEGIQELEEAYPDDGYAMEIGMQYSTQQQITGTVPPSYNTTTYTHRIAQDEFMGQFDDIDEIAYATANQILSHVVKPKINPVVPHTVLVHERSQQVYQEPLIVHQVHEVIGGTSSPKKAFPPPRWPVDEVSPKRRQAPKTATITSIFHEDEVVNGGRGGNNDTNDINKDTNTYGFFHTYPEITGEKDLLARNARRQGRNPQNRPNRGRQHQNPINIRRNPNRAARGVLGRGPAPQPQPAAPQPQPAAPQPQPAGPQPQPGGPQLQPGGPQPQPAAPQPQPGGPQPQLVAPGRTRTRWTWRTRTWWTWRPGTWWTRRCRTRYTTKKRKRSTK